MSKQLQNPEKIVESLIHLKDELWDRRNEQGISEIIYKINSCLYKEYPIVIQEESLNAVMIVNYIVTTQGFSGKKVTECETKAQVNTALGDCSFGALT